MDVFATLIVASITLCAIVAGAYGYGMAHLKHIKQNWVQYRCNPLYMPLAGAVGSDVFTNFTSCTMQSVHSYAGFVMDPIYQIFAEFHAIFSGILGSVNFIRKKIAGTVDGFLSIVKTTFDKIQNTMGVTLQLVGRIRTIMNRIMSVFVIILHIAKTGVDSGVSIQNGPIGQVADFFCFAPETLVRVRGVDVPIKDVKLGDMIGNAVVTSTIVFDGRSTAMVSIDGIKVSGNHKIWRYGWVPARTHPRARPTESLPLIYCLTTSTHEILVQNNLFCDYEETDHISEFWSDIARENGMSIARTYRETGFHPDTLLANGKKIRDVQIGDVIDGAKVLGVLHHSLEFAFVQVGNNWVCPGTLYGTPVRAAALSDCLEHKSVGMNLLTDTARIKTLDGIVFFDDGETIHTEVHARRDARVTTDSGRV